MTNRSKRIRALFERALDTPQEERSSWLLSECGDDAALRAEVEELLRFEMQTADLRVPPILERLEDEPVPERIGPYVVGERIGAGGFGEVYLAHQVEPFERNVALKIVRSGVLTRELLARFDAERQALALLDHPGIAKIFDAGATERGRPYFVMELVEGEAITVYCDRERLTLEERLGLFVEVCEAVQHAHRRGIIHRDLKPSNVLVARSDSGAAPKVIDFGVAKTSNEIRGEGTLVTEQGQLIGTPEYMSPEQADLGGVDVDTRTDVYALGVLLFELLCGALPFPAERLRSGSFTEALRIIREEDPPRPSARARSAADEEPARLRRTSRARLAQRLARDLDWIVLRALEKDRDRRYESAHALAADVRRYLAHEPVEAGPPSASYRLAKFARRNRVALAVASALLIALVVSLVESNRRRVLAEQSRDESEAVSAFLARTLGASNPERSGRDVTVVELLERAVAGDLEEFADQPLVRARLQHTIGEVYTRLGLTGEARALLEDALGVRRAELGESHVQTAETHNMLGVLLQEIGELDGAMEHYEIALETYGTDDEERAGYIAQQLNNIGVIHRRQGRLDEALEVFSRALEIRERVFGPEHPVVARTLANIGSVHQTRYEYERAKEYYEHSITVFEAALGPDHADLGTVLSNYGGTLLRLGDLDAALKILERTLALREASLGREHPEYGAALHNYAQVVHEVQGAEAAFPMYQEVLEIWEASYKPGHPRIIEVYFSLGTAHAERGEHAQVIERVEPVVASWTAGYGENDPDLVDPLECLGRAYEALGDLESAQARVERKLSVETANEAPDAQRAETLAWLVRLAEGRGDAASAERLEARRSALTTGD